MTCLNRVAKEIGVNYIESDARTLFEQAIAIDPKFKVAASDWNRMLRKRIKAVKFDSDVWFRNMADEVPSLFHTFPVPAVPLSKSHRPQHDESVDRVIKALKNWRSQQKYRVRTGRKQTLKYLTIRELMKYWSNPRATMSTTDLHIRETPMEKVIDTNALSEFNLLPLMHEETSSLEMMSLIISSAGAMTDSHSDDLDISNYCFCGAKLWLAWDTHEGLKNGLDDRDRVPIEEHARFDMRTFLSLKSARWVLVDDGNILYLPGNMAHRVVTLRPYIGVGAFYVSFPNALRTVSRWQQYTANWELDKNLDNSVPLAREEVAITVARTMKRGPKGLQKRAGIAYSDYALNSWVKAYPQSKRKKLSSAASIAEVYAQSA